MTARFSFFLTVSPECFNNNNKNINQGSLGLICLTVPPSHRNQGSLGSPERFIYVRRPLRAPTLRDPLCVSTWATANGTVLRSHSHDRCWLWRGLTVAAWRPAESSPESQRQAGMHALHAHTAAFMRCCAHGLQPCMEMWYTEPVAPSGKT